MWFGMCHKRVLFSTSCGQRSPLMIKMKIATLTSCARTVSAVLRRSTPCFAHSVRSLRVSSIHDYTPCLLHYDRTSSSDRIKMPQPQRQDLPVRRNDKAWNRGRHLLVHVAQ